MHLMMRKAIARAEIEASAETAAHLDLRPAPSDPTVRRWQGRGTQRGKKRLNIVDLFAGGGGASEGIRLAYDIGPAVAINHDPDAIMMHAANHPETVHFTEDVFKVQPFKPRRKSIDLLWASPSCTHYSRARGSKPVNDQFRTLPWAVVEWARDVQPRCIIMENVQEYMTDGPLGADGQPDAARKGERFRDWIQAVQLAGYRVEHRILNAADYGAPTARHRLFVIARRDGRPIVWPEPTHGPGRALPYRTAAECIDFELPSRSIFGRRRQLADKTQRRIARGLKRFVLDNPRPFIVPVTHSTSGDRVHDADKPLPTITASSGGEFAVVQTTLAPYGVQVGYGERQGQAPRLVDIQKPLGTIVAGGAKHALVEAQLEPVAAWIVKNYGGVTGHTLDRPLGTITTVDHHGIAEATVAAAHGELSPEAQAGAERVMGFLMKYYGGGDDGHEALGAGGGQNQPLDVPLHTIPTVSRFGLVTVHVAGVPHVITDIQFRMLKAQELSRAQGFPEGYTLTGTERNKIAKIGNSVPPPLAAAVARAQRLDEE